MSPKSSWSVRDVRVLGTVLQLDRVVPRGPHRSLLRLDRQRLPAFDVVRPALQQQHGAARAGRVGGDERDVGRQRETRSRDQFRQPSARRIGFSRRRRHTRCLLSSRPTLGTVAEEPRDDLLMKRRPSDRLRMQSGGCASSTAEPARTLNGLASANAHRDPQGSQSSTGAGRQLCNRLDKPLLLSVVRRPFQRRARRSGAKISRSGRIRCGMHRDAECGRWDDTRQVQPTPIGGAARRARYGAPKAPPQVSPT
jgi:hypothetical protein